MFATDREELPRFTELETQYEFLGELGRGSTAVVYLARERELDRKVAIKVVRATYVEDEEAAARLEREAHTVAGMQHPNIVMLYGTRRLRDNSLALIMQHVEGWTLKAEVQANGPLSFVRTEQILRDVGNALAYAHSHRIVHRDIKPENIYLDAETGIARISDFGIARPWDADSGLTLPGSAIGTPAYMSPEQIDGGVLDGRSDLYSLGLVGYEMLTGVRPWAGQTLFGIIYKQKHEELPSLGMLRPGIPGNLQEAIEGATRKDVERRWQDADAFLRVLSGRPPARMPVRVAKTGAEPPQPPVMAVLSGPPPAPREPLPAEPPVAGGHTITFDRRIETLAPRGEPPSERRASAGEPAATSANEPAAAPAAEVLAAQRADGVLRRLRRWPLVASVATGVVVVGTGVTLAFRDVPREMAADTRDAAPAPGGSVTAPESAGRTTPEGVDRTTSEAANRTAPPPESVVAAFALHGDRQEGMAGDTLPTPLVLRVEDGARAAVTGASVRFAIVSGEGEVIPAEAVTDAAGTASARWLPRTTGVHTVEARVEGVAEPTRFRATALPRPPARLRPASATALRGTAGTPSPLAVKVEDDGGNPLAGVEVRFAVRGGAGRVTPDAAVTGHDGIARAEWVLGTTRTQEAVANVPEAAGATVVFRATAAPAALPVQRTIAPGGTHTCVLAGDGTASCWGGNDSGQLGDGTASRRARPVRVAASEPFATLAAGVGHSCAIGISGAAFCWGSNTAGQLGDGTRGSRARPGRVEFAEPLTNVAVGMAHSCALDAAGRLFCWGQNTHGQLGDGTRADRPTPVRAGGPHTFRSVALGWAHTCALATDGAAYCWGRNGSGELGDGGTAERVAAARVSGGHRFSAIAAGSAHTCGLVSDGRILCWGQNSSGQLGNGGTGSSALPVAVLGADSFTALAAGGVHTCGVTRDGVAHCWGRNTYGQLGDGTTADRAQAAPVDGGLRFSAIFASGAHTCATAVGGGPYCWGFNLEGQIGDGTRSNQLRPVPVVPQG